MLLSFFDGTQNKLQLIADIGSASNGNPETAKALNMPFESALPIFDLVGSSNELVCLNRYISHDPIYVYNPFTIEYKTLPEPWIQSQSNVLGVVLGFGFDSVTMLHKAVKIVHYRMSNNDLVGADPEDFILTLGTSEWEKFGIIPYQLFSPTSEAEVKEKLHWLINFLQNGQDRYKDNVFLYLTAEKFDVVARPSCGCRQSQLPSSDTARLPLSCCVTLPQVKRGMDDEGL